MPLSLASSPRGSRLILAPIFRILPRQSVCPGAGMGFRWDLFCLPLSPISLFRFATSNLHPLHHIIPDPTCQYPQPHFPKLIAKSKR